MEQLLDRVNSLELTVARLIKWTNFQHENDDIITNNLSLSSSTYKNGNCAEIKIEPEIKLEQENCNVILPSSFDEIEEGEVRPVINLTDNPLGDSILAPNYSSAQLNFQPQVFIGGPATNLFTSTSLPYPQPHQRPNNSQTKRRTQVDRNLKKAVRTSRIERKNLAARSLHLSDVCQKTVFQCRLCNRTFVEKSELDRHLGRRHLKDQFHCVRCTVNFSNHDELDSHIRSTHPDTHKCSICWKEFKYKERLTAHEKVHK
ncbi:Zinc finger protein 28 [Folsomia candida]|uniref:Zinc finger protein 28 n=1 Tax=Folsomia candida TaxID=158441 RepID=A0A226DL75_FOLCA|nr:Zinc finger protein 28 [Folsomia candida]